MAISANSYGSTAGVAALVPRYQDETGDFSTETRPTLAQVETFIDQVSAILNMILASEGFAIPVTETTTKDALDLFVNEETAAICEGVNGSGRFGPREKTGTPPSRFSIILKDVKQFIESVSAGMERLGASRTYSITSVIGYRGTDADGNSIAPLFQREAFNYSTENWDNED